MAVAEGERCHSPGGVGANSGQGEKRGDLSRDIPVAFGGDDRGGGGHPQRSSRVAEAIPRANSGRWLLGSKTGGSGPAGHPFAPVRSDPRDGSLLCHELADENTPRRHTRFTPGERAGGRRGPAVKDRGGGGGGGGGGAGVGSQPTRMGAIVVVRVAGAPVAGFIGSDALGVR